MEKARSWGSTWRRRYLDEGAEGLRTRPRSDRPSRIPGEAMNRIRQKIEQEDCWTVEALYGLIKLETGVEYDLSYVRRLLRNLGYVRKVPLRRHVRRANRWKVAWFRRKTRALIKAKRRRGWTVGIQDESILVAEARPRKSVYNRKGKRPTITYGGDHSRTVVFGVITCDGWSLFRRYDRFTKDEFADFLRDVRLEFGRTLIIADRVPQHREAAVREALAGMKGRGGGAVVPAPGMSRAERDRGGLAPDEARHPGCPLRHAGPDVRGHRQVGGVVSAGAGHRKIPLQDSIVSQVQAGRRANGGPCAQPSRFRANPGRGRPAAG